MAVVRVPTPLQRLVGNQRSVAAAGATLAELIDDLDRQHPGIRARLVDDQGQLLSFINVFVNNEDVRFLQGLATPIAGDAEVSIVPAMAGGATASAGSRDQGNKESCDCRSCLRWGIRLIPMTPCSRSVEYGP